MYDKNYILAYLGTWLCNALALIYNVINSKICCHYYYSFYPSHLLHCSLPVTKRRRQFRHQEFVSQCKSYQARNERARMDAGKNHRRGRGSYNVNSISW